MEATFIYSLSDPDTKKVRYIGKSNEPERRFLRHLKDAHKKTSHKACWIFSLQERGKRPVLAILREVPSDDWQLWETEYISVFRECGDDLTNIADGGEGPSSEICKKISAAGVGNSYAKGFKHSAETRAKISAGLQGNIYRRGKKLSPEHRQKLIASNLGRVRSPETCLKISVSNLGKPKSEETRKKMSAAKRGTKHSAETREKMRIARVGKKPNLGNKHSAETREKMRVVHLKRKNNLQPAVL